MKLTEKMKKNLAILGGVLIGIGLIAAIGMQFGPKPSGEDVLPGTGETETELIVDPGDFEKKEEESKVVSREEESLVIHPGIGENQETDTQAVDSRSPQTDQTTQSIQPKPTKPEPPSKESWQQMLSATQMTPYGLTKALTKIASGTDDTIKDAVKQTEKGKGAEQGRSIKPQDKTGSYGEKRKPGDYLK